MDVDMGQVWQDYELSGVSEELDKLFPDYSFDLGFMLEQIITGDIIGALGSVADGIFAGTGQQLLGMKDVLIWILVAGVAASVISYFVEVFESRQIADLSFYFVYLLLMSVLLRCFQEAAGIAVETVENIISFIKIFVPAYLLSVGVVTGTTTATAYYGLMLLIIYLIQTFLVSIVVPCIYSYVLLSAINGVWIEEKLTMIVELLEKGIRLMLKLSLGAVTGISLIQSLITPVIDSAKASTLQKVVSVIPGIGNVADGVVDVVLGSAVIIKNSIGVVMLILLLAVCVVPLLKIFIIAAMLKIAAAFLGIISDKRITTCADKVGNASALLLRTAGTAMFLFVLTISVAALTTNRGF
ncbi:MAG: stage III sporulation protein AE [Lachnospiraceae bacterium]|nr:stage III sporulation protein AE [Lachnospiraceae bacterium]